MALDVSSLCDVLDFIYCLVKIILLFSTVIHFDLWIIEESMASFANIWLFIICLVSSL
jgi:hypothetical protein